MGSIYESLGTAALIATIGAAFVFGPDTQAIARR